VFVDCAAVGAAFLTVFTAGGTVSAFLRGTGAAVESNEKEREEEAN
jgi:hypothetical protein